MGPLCGVVETRLAIDRISPVLTSITIAVPESAPDAAICWPSACSVTYWRGWSMVSSSPWPGVLAFVLIAPP